MLGTASFVVGVSVVLLTAALGHCSSFGGQCPSPGGLHGDVYGGIAVGAVLATAVPLIAWRPSRRGVAVALAVTAAIVPVLTFFVGTALIGG